MEYPTVTVLLCMLVIFPHVFLNIAVNFSNVNDLMFVLKLKRTTHRQRKLKSQWVKKSTFHFEVTVRVRLNLKNPNPKPKAAIRHLFGKI